MRKSREDEETRLERSGRIQQARNTTCVYIQTKKKHASEKENRRDRERNTRATIVIVARGLHQLGSARLVPN